MHSRVTIINYIVLIYLKVGKRVDFKCYHHTGTQKTMGSDGGVN